MSDTASWGSQQQFYNKTQQYKNNSMERINIELSDNEILSLALQAHDKNITLNDHILDIVKQHIINDKNTNEKQLLTETHDHL